MREENRKQLEAAGWGRYSRVSRGNKERGRMGK